MPRPVGMVCDNGLFCDGSDVCDGAGECVGTADACPTGACGGCNEEADFCFVSEAGTVCREAVGECDVPETCDGSGVDCPEDAFAVAGTACDDDDPCTAPDGCDGAGSCPTSPP